MEGLKEKIEDEKERYKYIVEKCLYFSDINPTNIFINKLLLDPENEYKLNYNEGDTLKLDIKEKWGIEGFDAVIGNPPYQAPSNFIKNSKILWDKFTKKSINEWIKFKGYLLFIHPSGWRKPYNELLKNLLKYQIIYLKIFNDIEGNKLFNCSTRIDYYLLQLVPCYKTTTIYFENNEKHIVNLINNFGFIPNYGYKIYEKILLKLKNGIITEISSKLGTSNKNVSTIKNNIFKYPLFNSNSKKNGLNIRYSKIEHFNQKLKKVIFSNGRYIYPIYDNGILGTTQGGIYILVKNEIEGNNLIKFLNSSLIKFIIKSSKWSNFETNKEIFKYIEFPKLKSYSDDEIYNFFNISEKEIIYINNFI
jgi:hypothetical protein